MDTGEEGGEAGKGTHRLRQFILGRIYAAFTPHLSSDRSSRDTPTWALGSAHSPLGFSKKAGPLIPPSPKPRVKEEFDEEPGTSAVEPELDPGRITRRLDEVGIFGQFSKRADRPQESEATTSRVAPYVPLGLPRRSRPLEEAKLEEFRKIATNLFEELVLHEVEMDLLGMLGSWEGISKPTRPNTELLQTQDPRSWDLRPFRPSSLA